MSVAGGESAAGAGSPGAHLKASVVIGNIRCQKEYLPTESAFHASEVPAKAREARLAVKAWKRPPVRDRGWGQARTRPVAQFARVMLVLYSVVG